MNRDQAKQEIRANWRRIIGSMTAPARVRVNGEVSFICPLCKHGKQGDGLTKNPRSADGNGLKCFGCDFSGDIIELYQKKTGADYNTALQDLAGQLGIIIDKYTTADFAQIRKPIAKPEPTPEDEIADYTGETYVLNVTPEVNAAHEALKRTPAAIKYLKGRGLSDAIIDAYKLGYDAEGYNHFLKAHPAHQTGSKKAGLYNYILPYPAADGSYTYFLAEISDRTQVDDYNGKYRKVSAGNTDLKAQIFNERYLQNPPKVIFICEGIYDALSVEEVGGNALAFLGTAHRRFLSLCKAYRPKTHFVISLDNDGAGQMAIERVKAGLDALNIPYTVKTAEGAKDFNEALQQDRQKFSAFIQDAEKEALMDLENQKEEYLKTSAANELINFLGGIKANADTPALSTGFAHLDNALDGGLYEGLYIIGAISSLGKTTLALQIIDQLAQQGHDCLVFSLEMARSELIAKSISRLTYLKAKNKAHAKTTRGITAGARWKNYDEAERALINEAAYTYGDYAGHIYIHEGIGDIGVKQVADIVKQHIELTGNKPVVLIDYLQILAPYDLRASDKQNTDKAVLELKRLSRDHKIPVIGISSFNRDNYTAPVNNASFKESGAIEYSSDVLIGLQYDGMDYQEGEADGARQKRIRELVKEMENNARIGKSQTIQAKILKNRNGSKGQVYFSFYAMFNCFEQYEPPFVPVDEAPECFKGMKAK